MGGHALLTTSSPVEAEQHPESAKEGQYPERSAQNGTQIQAAVEHNEQRSDRYCKFTSGTYVLCSLASGFEVAEGSSGWSVACANPVCVAVAEGYAPEDKQD